jgi:hypothetical protein
MKGESAGVTSPTRHLGRLTEVSRDRGLLLIGLGVLDGVVLALLLHHDAETWWLMALAGAFFTAAYLLFDGAGRSLIRQVERRSEALDGEIAIEQHPALLSTTLGMLLSVAALTAVLVLVTIGVNDVALTELLPAQLIGFGLLGWASGERVRTWERQHDSEVLVDAPWRLRPKYRYFVRSRAS